MARILIIEDDPQIREMLAKTLKHEGHDVVEALDCKEGLKLCRENPADLVITNMIIAKTEGIDIIMELQRDFPYVKIIAISGGGHNIANNYLYMAKTRCLENIRQTY
jgi:DNA-binding response OmpR family regulator